MNIDDKIIDWSMKMVRMKGADWISHDGGIDACLSSVRYREGSFIYRCFYGHLLYLVNVVVDDDKHYSDEANRIFASEDRSPEGDRRKLVVWGLLLYVLRCGNTDYWAVDEEMFIENMKPLLIALIHDLNFLSNYKNYPIEFIVESAKANCA